MLGRTLRFLGGHDHGMPTTKEAAHLTPEWVMSRKIPHAPGPGKRYATFAHPQIPTRFQFNIAGFHEVRCVSLRGAPEPHDTTARTRLSERSIDAVTTGLECDLNPAPHRPADRLADAPPSPAKVPSVMSIKDRMQYDFEECNTYMHLRGGDIAHRLKDYNPKGHTRELFPWVEKPPAPPNPPGKK